jgi:MYXO-CTERM domain-containing protein
MSSILGPLHANLSSRLGRRVTSIASAVLLTALYGQTAHATITGTVVDAADQSPIPGALVSIQASDVTVLADEQGEFEIPDTGEVDLVIVGAMKGYFNAGQLADDGAVDLVVELEAVPAEDNLAYVFTDPLTCGACHVDQYSEWLGSPMAQAGVNTWVYDIYNGLGTPGGMGGFVYLNDSVHAEENPESECSSCHQPETWAGEPFTALGDLANPTPGIAHGVACDLCHKIADVDDAKPNFPGIHPDSVTMTRPEDPGWAIQYGLLGDVDFVQGTDMRAAYQPQLGAAVCGTCHQDKNDHDADGDFEDEGGIISEPTYIEWLDSPYGDLESEQYADCVDCHMPATGASTACNQLPTLDRPDGDVRSHEVRGTTPEFLDNAVTMEMETAVVDGEIQVDVTITNDKTGHHVPTGVTIRNMILIVEATHAADGSPLTHTGDQLIHELGGVDGAPEDGYFGGMPGKLYAKINHDAEGNGPTFFTDAVGIISDTRIPALESDATQFTFSSDVGGEVDIHARLIYRRSWRVLLDAKGWVEDGHGEILEDVEAPHFGHLMEEATESESLPEEPDCPEPPCDDDTGGSDETDSTPEGTDTDTGGEGASQDGDDGCGCSADDGKAPILATSLFLLVGGLARRRQRTRGR